ncbi:MAG: transglycosylase SLT domain-containing protein [Rhodospirillaceae bacterium]|jgi:hypothetical protein|nr:transglycosylase SLT domain-containing protein [Rhodospirillaceae bacterium]MBT5243451.1 transglycosylase SLT domain-containing protein [Rhodospirillaceae bacterium]MBT5562039.1 transglycosylase SLT domain-containing protein [Rhodospirillaceae bacterium]MBT6242212.1 transglycosylase SLT domain-containing protein [Rhodospirillaceae bacterium]MBT7136244.1 transglycosylase SLT domain-containing protein [Rhodospirillaceae bacterium]
MFIRFLLVLTALTAAFAGSRTVHAETVQAIGNAQELCDIQVARVERARSIPQHLLKAISLAETGRWDALRQENYAWPWTVTSLGKGHFFPDKQSALRFVHRLKARGITNIDVGCMQINLFYHGSAFASLEQAMDPATNVAYAARYLNGLYRTTRSWTKASGFYHSTTPKRAKAYKMKVLKYWNQQRKYAALQDRKSVDYARMATLNKNHKAQKEAALSSAGKSVRGNQMAAWRTDDPSGHDMATLAAMRRVSKQAQWHEKYFGSTNKGKGEAFAKKRRKQLDKWRLTRVAAN